jgi:hypothetical protein
VKRIIFFLLSSFLFTSCASAPQTVPTQTITAYATSSAQVWMRGLFSCANEHSIVVEVTVENPDIYLRVGELEDLVFPAYQIGEEEIVVVVNRESAIRNLSLVEVQAVFAGQGDESSQVWVYASGEDLQGLFDQFVMKGRSVTSYARMASSPREMSASLNSESDAIGFLPKHWVTGNIRAVYSLGLFPVLAVTNETPQGAVRTILGCLQVN